MAIVKIITENTPFLQDTSQAFGWKSRDTRQGKQTETRNGERGRKSGLGARTIFKQESLIRILQILDGNVKVRGGSEGQACERPKVEARSQCFNCLLNV